MVLAPQPRMQLPGQWCPLASYYGRRQLELKALSLCGFDVPREPGQGSLAEGYLKLFFQSRITARTSTGSDSVRPA